MQNYQNTLIKTTPQAVICSKGVEIKEVIGLFLLLTLSQQLEE
jgi:hypothetical protein